jgi:hypothetical protein
VPGDFFAGAASSAGFDPAEPGRRFDAVLVDIDHSPRHLLHPDHAGFYTPAGLRHLAGHLQPGGVFGLWSNDPPDPQFTAMLAAVFPTARAEIVAFDNPLQQRTSTNTIYLARTPQYAGSSPPTSSTGRPDSRSASVPVEEPRSPGKHPGQPITHWTLFLKLQTWLRRLVMHRFAGTAAQRSRSSTRRE